MQTSNKSRAFTRPGKWAHIGRPSTHGGIFPIFKRALRTTSNKKQRAYTPARDLYEHAAEHNQYVADLFGSVQTALDDFADAVCWAHYLEDEARAECEWDDDYERSMRYHWYPDNALMVEQPAHETWLIVRPAFNEVEATIRLDRDAWVWRAHQRNSEELTIPFEGADEHAMIRLMMTLIRMQ